MYCMIYHISVTIAVVRLSQKKCRVNLCMIWLCEWTLLLGFASVVSCGIWISSWSFSQFVVPWRKGKELFVFQGGQNCTNCLKLPSCYCTHIFQKCFMHHDRPHCRQEWNLIAWNNLIKIVIFYIQDVNVVCRWESYRITGLLPYMYSHHHVIRHPLIGDFPLDTLHWQPIVKYPSYLVIPSHSSQKFCVFLCRIRWGWL